ncbi:MAG: hypothetical protein IPM18_06820 [Phycisphaerales bacterium]|nr:hypothetical protein [Phycisphaerales bacterium]
MRTGDPVPGQPAGVTFTAFGEPIIDGWNRVAFWALYGGTGARGRSGLYVWNGTEIVRILDDDPDGTIAVPGRGAEFRWGSSIANYDPRALDISWGGGSRLLFVSEVARRTGSSSTRIRGVYRWRATDNSLARVADRDQLATNYADVDVANNGDPLFEAEFFRPGITDDGFAIFSTTYQYITTTSLFPTGSGVFTSNGTTLTPLSDDQIRPQPVPDQAATKFFRNPERPTTVSGGGDMIFQSKWGSPTSGPGVFMRRGSTSFRVIDNRTAATWPGLPNIMQVNPTNAAYAGVAIGPLGHIAVATTVATSGGNRAAVLLWNPYAVTWMELTGSLGTPADALFTGVNDDGDAIVQVGTHLYRAGPASQQRLTDVLPIGLQVANVTWNATGGALNNLGRAALPYTHPGGQAGLAYWTGEQFLIVADEVQNAPAGLLDIRTKSDPWRDRPGRSGILNDFDILVFRALFNDNSETLYLVRGE